MRLIRVADLRPRCIAIALGLIRIIGSAIRPSQDMLSRFSLLRQPAQCQWLDSVGGIPFMRRTSCGVRKTRLFPSQVMTRDAPAQDPFFSWTISVCSFLSTLVVPSAGVMTVCTPVLSLHFDGHRLNGELIRYRSGFLAHQRPSAITGQPM
jgi:hypothetical protein